MSTREQIARGKMIAHDAAGYESDYIDFAEFDDEYGNRVAHGDLSMQRMVEGGHRESTFPTIQQERESSGAVGPKGYDTNPVAETVYVTAATAPYWGPILAGVIPAVAGLAGGVASGAFSSGSHGEDSKAEKFGKKALKQLGSNALEDSGKSEQQTSSQGASPQQEGFMRQQVAAHRTPGTPEIPGQDAFNSPKRGSALTQIPGYDQSPRIEPYDTEPFQSQKQSRFMHAAEARGEIKKGTSHRWAKETPGGVKSLPMYKHKG